MSDEDNFPGVEINTREEDLKPGPSSYTYVHLDDFERDKNYSGLRIYTFESEERKDELLELLKELRQEYTLAVGIQWPDEIRDNIEAADTDRLRAFEWAIEVLPYMDYDVESLPSIADAAERRIVYNSD